VALPRAGEGNDAGEPHRNVCRFLKRRTGRSSRLNRVRFAAAFAEVFADSAIEPDSLRSTEVPLGGGEVKNVDRKQAVSEPGGPSSPRPSALWTPRTSRPTNVSDSAGYILVPIPNRQAPPGAEALPHMCREHLRTSGRTAHHRNAQHDLQILLLPIVWKLRDGIG